MRDDVARAAGRWLVLSALALATPALADVFRPAYLELKQRDADTFDVLWKVPAAGESLRLAIHVRFPEGTTDVTEPRGDARGPAPITERWTIRRAGGLAGGEIRIDGLPAGISDVLARVERTDGTTQVVRLVPGTPALRGRGAAGRRQRVAHLPRPRGHPHPRGRRSPAVRAGARADRRATAAGCSRPSPRSRWRTASRWRRRRWASCTCRRRRSKRPSRSASCSSRRRSCTACRAGPASPPGRRGWWRSRSACCTGWVSPAPWPKSACPERAIPLALLFFNVGVEVGQLAFVAAVLTVVAAVSQARIAWPRWARAIPAYAIGAVAMFWVIERVLAFGG